jgi:predicted small metal-binding protein
MVTAYEFTCSDDGEHSFQVHTEDRDEVIEVVQRHAKDKHDMSMSEADIEDGLQEVEV